MIFDLSILTYKNGYYKLLVGEGSETGQCISDVQFIVYVVIITLSLRLLLGLTPDHLGSLRRILFWGGGEVRPLLHSLLESQFLDWRLNPGHRSESANPKHSLTVRKSQAQEELWIPLLHSKT